MYILFVDSNPLSKYSYTMTGKGRRGEGNNTFLGGMVDSENVELHSLYPLVMLIYEN